VIRSLALILLVALVVGSAGATPTATPTNATASPSITPTPDPNGTVMVNASTPSTATAAPTPTAADPVATPVPSPTPAPTPHLDRGGQRLSESLVVLRSSVDSEGVATVVLYAEDRQDVTVTDAALMAYDSGERIPQVEQTVYERSTIQIQTADLDGQRAVTVSAESGLYPVWLDRTSTGGNPLAETSSTTGWLGGMATAMAMLAMAGRRHLRDRDLDPNDGWPT
jgi:hypothetical protein